MSHLCGHKDNTNTNTNTRTHTHTHLCVCPQTWECSTACFVCVLCVRSCMCVYMRACVQVMHNFSKIWESYKPTSVKPSSRGFHAMWLSGFNLFIHGGQGPEGVGAASVRSDTWVYDVFNKVWTQLGSSDASPAGEKMSVNLLYASTAMAFGGINKDSRPVANSVLFDPKSGWSNIEPAGSRPLLARHYM